MAKKLQDLTGYVDAADFGLSPSKTGLQNADAMTAAIAYAAANGYHVHIPKGTFNITQFTFKNQVSLRGAGMQLTKFVGTQAVPMLTNQKADNADLWHGQNAQIGIRDMSFDGNNIATWGWDLDFQAFFKHENLGFQRFTQGGVNLIGHLLGQYNNLQFYSMPRAVVLNKHQPDIHELSFQPNFLVFNYCVFSDITQKPFYASQGAGILINRGDFENCGNDDSQGNNGLMEFMSMCDESGEGLGVTIRECWAERNGGYFVKSTAGDWAGWGFAGSRGTIVKIDSCNIGMGAIINNDQKFILQDTRLNPLSPVQTNGANAITYIRGGGVEAHTETNGGQFVVQY